MRAERFSSNKEVLLTALARVHCHLVGLLTPREFDELVSDDPDYADAHDLMGQQLTFLGLPGDAEMEFRTAIALNGGSARIRYNLSVFLYNVLRFEDAEAAVRYALVLDPLFPHATDLLELIRKQRAIP